MPPDAISFDDLDEIDNSAISVESGSISLDDLGDEESSPSELGGGGENGTIAPGLLGQIAKAANSMLGVERQSDLYTPGSAVMNAGQRLYDDPKGAAADAIEMGAGGAAAIGTEALSANPMMAAGAFSIGEQLGSQFNQAVGLRPEQSLEQDLQDYAVHGTMNQLLPFSARVLKSFPSRFARTAGKPGAVAGALNRPGSVSKAERVIANELNQSEPFILDSGIYRGGTEFDPVTKKFINPPTPAAGQKKPYAEDIHASLNTALGDIAQKRNDALTNVDLAAQTFNATAAPDKQIRGSSLQEVETALKPLRQAMESYERTGATKPEAAGLGAVFAELKANFQQYGLLGSGHSLRPVSSMEEGAARKTAEQFGELSPTQVNEMVENMYEALRRMREFDTSIAAQALQDPSAYGKLEKESAGLLEATFGLRKVRDAKVSEIFSKTADNDAAKAYLQGLDADRVKTLNDAYGHTKRYTEALGSVIGDLNVGANRGRRTLDLPPENQTAFNRLGRLAGWPWGKAKDIVGVGPEHQAIKLADKIPERLESIRGWRAGEKGAGVNRLANAAQSPYGVIAANLGVNLLSDDSKQKLLESASITRERFPEMAPQPVAIPRTVKGLNDNIESFVTAVGEETQDPATVQMVQETLTSRPDVEKLPLIGGLLRHFPKLNSLFTPSKSGVPSEFEGQIHSEEDLSAIAQTIESNPDLSVRDRALQFRDLFEKKKYSQGKVSRAPR